MKDERTFFAVISQPRSGTHLIRNYLNCHPRICCEGEIFHPNIRWPHLEHFSAGDPALTVLHWLWQRQEKSGQHVGFQCHDPLRPGAPRYGWHPEQLLKFDPLPRIVWLRRRNLVAQYASWLMAVHTRRWVSDGRNEQQDARRSTVLRPDPKQAADWIAGTMRRRLELRAQLAVLPSCSIDYESLCSRPAAECARVFRFLGLEGVALETRTVPQRKYRTPGVFSNYEEIVAEVAKVVDAKMLGEWMSGESA